MKRLTDPIFLNEGTNIQEILEVRPSHLEIWNKDEAHQYDTNFVDPKYPREGK
jgi:hypothetical protein